MKRQKSKGNKGVSKEQWLAKALEMLEIEGHDAIKVEKLAAQLGTSRSGFYYHFKNREDLLYHLLSYWEEEYTTVITDSLDMKKLDAATRLLITMEMIRKRKLPKYDLAMTAWAKIDPLVDKVVKKVVRMRHDFTRTIFEELGFAGDDLEMRARLFHCYHAWEEVMFTDESEDVNVRLQKLRHKMFLR